MKPIIRVVSLIGLVVAVGLAGPVGRAQTNPSPATVKREPAKAPKGSRAIPFRGTLTGVDKVSKTIKVGERTFQITSTTKLYKDGKPATFDQATVGEPITGSYKKLKDGKLQANSVYFGGKGVAKPAKEKPSGQEKEPAAPQPQ